MPYGFRCKTCGHLHDATHAGVRKTPAACACCGAGVSYDARGNRTFAPEVWEVLADATPERLAELGLTPDDVVRHQPCHERDAAQNLARAKEALATLDAKQRAWSAKSLEAHQADLAALHDRLDELEAADADDDGEHARIEHERAGVRQQITDLLGREYTDRDAALRAELESVVARNGRPDPRGPRKVRAGARQGFTSTGKA